MPGEEIELTRGCGSWPPWYALAPRQGGGAKTWLPDAGGGGALLGETPTRVLVNFPRPSISSGGASFGGAALAVPTRRVGAALGTGGLGGRAEAAGGGGGGVAAGGAAAPAAGAAGAAAVSPGPGADGRLEDRNVPAGTFERRPSLLSMVPLAIPQVAFAAAPAPCPVSPGGVTHVSGRPRVRYVRACEGYLN
jgi:hypothetical protein